MGARQKSSNNYRKLRNKLLAAPVATTHK